MNGTTSGDNPVAWPSTLGTTMLSSNWRTPRTISPANSPVCQLCVKPTPTASAPAASGPMMGTSSTRPANEPINSGARARCFADYMRIHAYEATGGVTYAQMPHYATADGKGTNDVTKALMSNGRPVDNVARNVWVTETALSTALNVSYMADQLGNFGIVVGIALLLSGFGFVILAVGGALRAGSWLFENTFSKTSAQVTRPVGA